MRRWLFVALIPLLAACGAQDAAHAATANGGATATAQTQQSQPALQAVYVDVRTPQEYAAGHVNPSLLIPYDQMEQRWQELEPYKNYQIVVYCRTGHRAAIARQVLEQHGFTNVVNGGGISGLAAQGLPISR